MQRIRALTLDAAAGKPIAPDLARATTATASSGDASRAVDGDAATAWQPSTGSGTQWIRLDLGRQAQLDAVQLKWTATHGRDYKVQVSYDGARWTDAQASTGGDGGTDLWGVNGKARYLRVEVTAGSAGATTYGLSGLEVAGQFLDKVNLAGGRTYTRSASPNHSPDTAIESTDGVLADAWDDGRSYGYQAPTTSADVVIDLGSVQSVDSAKLHAYEEYPGYRPDSIRVMTSLDGATYVQRGVQYVPRGGSGVWYDFSFAPTTARYVKVTFSKAYGGDATAMLLDEIEVYAAGPANLASGRPYTKTHPAIPDASYPDTGNKESTDGQIAGDFRDGRGYGFRLLTAGESTTVGLTLDLESSRSLRQVRVAKFDNGVNAYQPDIVRVYTGDDPVTMTLRRETTTAAGLWFDLPVTAAARYLRVELVKTRTHDFADYLFIDEIQVFDTTGANVALGKRYGKTHPATPDASYPDTGGKESTDGAVAGGYGDGLGYGYRLLTAGQTTTVDVTLDLGASRPLRDVRVRAFDDNVHDYAADNVVVFAGDDPLALTPVAETNSVTGQWFHLPIPATAGRYVTVRLTKSRLGDYGDYLFVDEVAVA